MTLECVQPLISFRCRSLPQVVRSLPLYRPAGNPRCESPGPKRAETSGRRDSRGDKGGPRSSRCGRPLKAAYRPSIGGKEVGYGMQPRRMQMRSSRGTGLLRRLLSKRAPHGNGVSSPHLPLWPRALWIDWRPRYAHVGIELSEPVRGTEGNCNLPTALRSKGGERNGSSGMRLSLTSKETLVPGGAK